MSNVLIAYASKYGQTEKVARRIAAALTGEGHVAELMDVAHPTRVDAARFQAVLVGAPVYMGKHPRSIVDFVRRHRELLDRVPSAFFSVSMGMASKKTDGRAQTMASVEALIQRTGWRPKRVELFAGALPYTRYGFLTRFIIKKITAKEGGDTDTSRDFEYTDWSAVDRLAHELGLEAAAAPVSAPPAAAPAPGVSVSRDLLLFCGLLSSLLYVAINVVGAVGYAGYSSASQTVSELTAIGAPNKPFLVALGLTYGVLVVAFGLGIWEAAERNLTLRRTAGLMLLYGVLDFLWPLVPMHQRGETATYTDTLHIALAATTVAVMMLTLYAGARAMGRQFRRYTIATAAVLFGFGLLTAREGPRIGQDLPTPWIGVYERINIGVFLLWMAVLSIALLRIEWHFLGAARHRRTA